MARTPYATEIHDSPQKSTRIPSSGQPTFIVIHHAATESFEAVVKMEMGGKQVSSTVVIKDGRVASMFDEVWRAWSLSSQFWDSVSLSSETCNSGGAAQGWPISEASYTTLAKVVAEWCVRWNIPCNRERIMGHREVYIRYGQSYATACPGGIDLDRVVRDANARIAAGTAGGGSTPIVEKEITEMEMYIKVPDGRVLHISNGVKVIFESPEEYKNWRSIVSTYKTVTPGATNVVPPELSEVMGVTWDGYTQICQHFGVAA